MSAYNLHTAKVGDLVRVTLEDAEYDMTVHTVMEPGAYGVGYQHGPRVLAWIRPGGYGITLNASNVVALEAIEVCSECEGTGEIAQDYTCLACGGEGTVTA